MATRTWTGVTSAAWATNTNWSADTLPVHGDDVVFDGSGFGGNYCTTGPTTTVLLASITTQNAYSSTGSHYTCCYAKCGMTGAAIPTVTFNDASVMTGGVVTTLNLESGGAQSYANRYDVIQGGTVTTLNSRGAYMRISGGTITTANMYVYNQVDAGTITTMNLVATADAQILCVGVSTITTLIANRNTIVKGYSGCVGTTWTLDGRDNTTDTPNDIRDTAGAITTLNLYGAADQVSLTWIVAGNNTNIYLCDKEQILYDYDGTHEVIADTTLIPSYAEGSW
jgi:hypothetical protein